ATPDPDRGYALAALTGELDLPSVKPAMLRALVAARVDETLLWYSYDYVGDFAETVALIWPPKNDLEATMPGATQPRAIVEPQGSLDLVVPTAPATQVTAVAETAGGSPRLSTIVERLLAASRLEGPKLIEDWLDRLDAVGRWALIKLVVGGM